MTLYLKYRPKNLDELDSASVSESLKKIVKSGKIPHAFLFAGPKGIGKTSAARILAKIINCLAKPDPALQDGGLPCDKCEQCNSITKGNNLDVIEMDAASHRGIDDVRTLRDAVKLAPVKSKMKIYIIDEAHMLTTEASNALLKTLEEPPKHVVFILATTNPEKLIDTIKSRTTYIPFKKATAEEMVRSLKRVVVGEKIKITDDALRAIAKASDGAFRDGIKILEQVISEGVALDKDSLEEYLFRNKSFDTDRFIDLLIKRDTKTAISEIGKLGPSGVTTEIFLESLLSKLRAGLLMTVGSNQEGLWHWGNALTKDELISLIELFTEASRKISDSPIEELPIELAVIKWDGGATNSEELKTENEDKAEETVKEGVNPQHQDFGVGVNDEIWKTILSSIKPINASIEALLRAARPIGYDGRTLTLGVFYRFHKERLEDNQHRRVLEDIVGKVLQSPTRVICTLVEPPPKKVIEEAKVEPVLTEGQDKDIIKVAEEIFGN